METVKEIIETPLVRTFWSVVSNITALEYRSGRYKTDKEASKIAEERREKAVAYLAGIGEDGDDAYYAITEILSGAMSEIAFQTVNDLETDVRGRTWHSLTYIAATEGGWILEQAEKRYMALYCYDE